MHFRDAREDMDLTHSHSRDVEGPLGSAERYADNTLRYQMSLSLRANSRASKPVYS